MANSAYSDNWYDHPMYARYWQHYNQAMSWYQKHRRAYRKAMEAAYGPMAFPTHHRNIPTRSGRHVGGSRRSRYEERDRSGRDKEEQEDTSEESESEMECDVTKEEISQELREYFAQTERHREELKRQQEEEAVRHESYILADHDLGKASERRSISAPLERPGERRNAEMKRLYGESAPRIQAMETAMQLNFDRNCDRMQPKYWPVIPLKL